MVFQIQWRKSFPFAVTVSFLLMLVSNTPSVARGDEGMYLFNEIPRQQLVDRYGFDPDEKWLEHLRLSSVRLNVGGSGSFVSSDGLVLTNHHVASDTLQKLSRPDRNLIDDGFLATSPTDELRAPDLEINQLVSIEIVTDRVEAAVESANDSGANDSGANNTDANASAAAASRRAVIAKIEKESLEQTGLRSDVVKLYGGAEYHLYRYKKYTDVRLVWAPEVAAAFFGGDADNFEYPRYNLDATLFRVYENDQPAKLDHFLSWSDAGVRDGELVFVSGNPGRTQRIFTAEALEYLRDKRLPYVLDYLRRREIMLQQFSLRGAESKRRARDELFGIQNARKAYSGMLAGLQNPQTIAAKESSQRSIASDRDVAAAIEKIASIQNDRAQQLGRSVDLRSGLFSIAMRMVLLAEEDPKPNSERLREFSDAGRESFLQSLLSDAPLYRDLEQYKLADEIAHLIEKRGGQDALVVAVLDGQSPSERAAAAVDGSKLCDASERQEILDQMMAGEPVDDSMIELARLFQPEYRRVRSTNEAIEERESSAYGEVADFVAAEQKRGDDASDRPYPDATFTLRLAFGTVRGYVEDGQWIDPTTNIGGAYQHAASHRGQEDFDLPPSWIDHRDEVDLETQLNFVCTADIIGGNSGSPVVNREGQLIGLIFDGNIQSLVSDYVYDDVQGRAVSVSAVAIKETLRNIYKAAELADSLGK